MKKERVLYIDVIKVFSMFLVVLLHCAGQTIHLVPLESSEFAIANFIDSMTRVAVPLFVMTSGAYFLNNENKLDLKKLFTKNIFKIILVLILSSAAIELAKYLVDPQVMSIKKFLIEITLGDDLLWFFYALIGLYLVTPLLRCITKSKKNTLYFLILYFVFVVFVPSVNYLLEVETFSNLLSNFQVFFVQGLVGYYVLGYYLDTYVIKKAAKKVFYVLGIIGFALTFILTQYFSLKMGKFTEFYYENNSITVLFGAILIFLLIKDIIKDKKYSNNIFKNIATSTLYIYPIHRLLLIIMPAFFNIKLQSNPAVLVPAYAILLFGLSLLLSLLIKYILNLFKNRKFLGYIGYFLILIFILIWFILKS